MTQKTNNKYNNKILT